MVKISGYYFITDSILSKNGNVSDVTAAVSAGVKIVQYRNKNGSTRAMFEEALKLKKICKDMACGEQGRTIFLINDRVDIALAVDADGVHIGQNDLPYETAREMLGKKKVIGVTVRNLAEAETAEKTGADYIGVSPIFSTNTKPDAGLPSGVELIKKIKVRLKRRIPMIAIGGINLLNAADVVNAGADGLCAISAVVAKNDVRAEIKKFQKLFYKFRTE